MQTVLQNLWNDTRYASRQLSKSPAFALTALVTLGLGLGATATMYNIVSDVLTAPLPYHAPQQLVGIAFTFPAQKPNHEVMGSSGDFLKQHATSFASMGIAEDGNTGVNLSFSQGRCMRAGHPPAICRPSA
jgi:hypothetical protein